MAANLADDTFKCISLNIFFFFLLYKISLKYVTWNLINNMAELVQIMAWRRTDDKPLFKAMLVRCGDACIAPLGLSDLKKISSRM